MYDEFLDFACVIARDAGKLALQYFRAPLAVDNKLGEGFDPVTEADKSVENMIRDAITARFPAHGILGEEHGEAAADSEYRWVIDPIDGTRAFITGVPAWGILIALQHKGETVLGVMAQPFLQEIFAASPDRAFYQRGTDAPVALASSGQTDLSAARLYCTHPSMFDEIENGSTRFQRVADKVRMSRFGGDCYSYVLLALGHVDLVVEADLKIYDVAALIPLIRAAGGVITDWEGGSPELGGAIVAAATPELHAEALALLRND